MSDLAPPAHALAPAAFALIAISCAVKLLGFAEKQLIAYQFGLDGSVDAWFVAVAVPTALFLLTRELVEAAYLPIFMRRLESGDPDRAWQLFTILMMAIALLSSLAAGGIFLAADPLAALLAPGLSPANVDLTARLIRASVIGSVFLSMSSLTYITLNGFRRFAAPAFGDLVLKLVSIGCIALLAADLGPFVLVLGFVLGGAGRLAVHILALRKWLPAANWPWHGADDVRPLLALMAPLMVGVLFAQLSDLVANYFSSLAGPGAVAARTFAKKIVDLPVLLVPYALSVVAFPHFVVLINRGALDSLDRLLSQVLAGLVLLFSSVTVALIFLSQPVVALVFQRGAFDAAATQATAAVVSCYASGLVAFAVEPLLVAFYFSMRDTRTPVVVGIGCVIVEIALAAALVGTSGAAGVAAALAIAKSIKIAILWVLLKRCRPGFKIRPGRWTVFKLLAGFAAASIVLPASMATWPPPGADAPLYAQFAYCAVLGAISLAVHFAIAAMVPGAERNWTARFMVKRLRRKPGGCTS